MNMPGDGGGIPGGRVLTVDEVARWRGPPLILFVGVRTGGSSVHAVFGRWAGLLGRPWTLRGVDLPLDTATGTYRRLLAAMRANPAVRGAVITAHKLRLYRACAAGLDHRDRLVDLTREVNALATDGTVAAHVRDALSLTRILSRLRTGHGSGHGSAGPSGRHVLCLGAGGAATALLLAMYTAVDGGAAPRGPYGAVFADVDPRALEALRGVAVRAGLAPGRVSFVQVDGPRDGDRLVGELPSPGLVVNATGLGKDAPGSPVTGRAPFGPGMTAWDLNYRGGLVFLRQAGARGAHLVDGWDYFVAGWAGALTAIAGTGLTGALLGRFAATAAAHRPPRAG